jgi:REP element-mobilizing transposase RayT
MSIKTKYLSATEEYFHVYNRGINHSKIFLEPLNYSYFLRRIEENLDCTQLKIIAYCLMPNHYHFILKQIVPSAMSNFIKGVCDGYTKALNKKYNRSGHLFEGKYKLKNIDDSSYLVHLSCYVHLNPVSSGIVNQPENWEYSSCRAYLGIAPNTMISPEIVLNQFANIHAYKKYLEDFSSTEKEKIKVFLFDEEY